MTFYFLIEVGAGVGLGHWMRCYRLAEQMAELGHTIVVVTDPVMQQTDLLVNTNFIEWFEIDCGVNDIDVINQLRKQNRMGNPVYIVIDGYGFDSHYRNALKSVATKVICFDDINHLGKYYCDLLINTSDAAHQLDYSKSAPEATLCLGSDYVLLPRYYLEAPENHPINWDQKRALTLVMGGSDPLGLTVKLVTALSGIDWDHAPASIEVVTTGLYPNLAEIHEIIFAGNIKVNHHFQRSDLSEVFCQSRLVVTAAGGTSYEVQACLTPALLVCTAVNQNENAGFAEQQGLSVVYDYIKDDNIDSLISELVSLWHNEEQLLSMRRRLLDKQRSNPKMKLIDQINHKITSGREDV